MLNKLKKFFIPHEGNDFKPGFFKEATLFGILSLSLILLISSFSSNYVITKTNLLGNVYTSTLVDLANEDRKENNIPTLVINKTLQQAAQMKANDMATNSYFAHTSPAGITPWAWFKEAGYAFSYAGENLAINFEESEDVNNAWLASPTHRANIMNEKFTEIGIATAEGFYQGRKTTFIVQMFGTPKVIKPTPIVATETKITNPGSPINNINQSAQVLGSEVLTQSLVMPSDQNLVTLEENDKFAIVQDLNSEPAQPVIAPAYTAWYEKVLINQPGLVNKIFVILIAIVIIALGLFIGIEIKTQHPKKIAYGVALLAVLVLIVYLNQDLVLTSKIIF